MQSPKLSGDGDLVIDDSGDLVMIDGADELGQCCRLVLGTNKGEWFLNPELGIDFSKLNGKRISEEAVKEQVRAGLRQEPRIATIDEINVQMDTAARQSLVTFRATAVTGEVVEGGTG